MCILEDHRLDLSARFVTPDFTGARSQPAPHITELVAVIQQRAKRLGCSIGVYAVPFGTRYPIRIATIHPNGHFSDTRPKRVETAVALAGEAKMLERGFPHSLILWLSLVHALHAVNRGDPIPSVKIPEPLPLPLEKAS